MFHSDKWKLLISFLKLLDGYEFFWYGSLLSMTKNHVLSQEKAVQTNPLTIFCELKNLTCLLNFNLRFDLELQTCKELLLKLKSTV